MCWWQFQDYNTPKITTMIYVENVWKCLMTTSKVAPICAAKLQNWLRIASSPWKGVVSTLSQNAELPRSKENSEPPKIIKNLDQFHHSLTKNLWKISGAFSSCFPTFPMAMFDFAPNHLPEPHLCNWLRGASSLGSHRDGKNQCIGITLW